MPEHAVFISLRPRGPRRREAHEGRLDAAASSRGSIWSASKPATNYSRKIQRNVGHCSFFGAGRVRQYPAPGKATSAESAWAVSAPGAWLRVRLRPAGLPGRHARGWRARAGQFLESHWARLPGASQRLRSSTACASFSAGLPRPRRDRSSPVPDRTRKPVARAWPLTRRLSAPCFSAATRGP